VGRTDVEEPSVRRQSEHGFDVVGKRWREWSLCDASARNFCSVHARLVAGVGGDITARRRGESQYREVQRLAGTWKCANVFRLEALLLCELLDEILGQPILVAAGVCRD